MGLGDINFLIVDVDGVLTDGRITYDDTGREWKSFDIKDGQGIK
ncbi:MAG TPA: phenylphosphate carboxylase subunit delta, partial [Candidatus Tripitaka californicus]